LKIGGGGGGKEKKRRRRKKKGENDEDLSECQWPASILTIFCYPGLSGTEESKGRGERGEKEKKKAPISRISLLPSRHRTHLTMESEKGGEKGKGKRGRKKGKEKSRL